MLVTVAAVVFLAASLRSRTHDFQASTTTVEAQRP